MGPSRRELSGVSWSFIQIAGRRVSWHPTVRIESVPWIGSPSNVSASQRGRLVGASNPRVLSPKVEHEVHNPVVVHVLQVARVVQKLIRRRIAGCSRQYVPGSYWSSPQPVG
jgi:hypothetical protein